MYFYCSWYCVLQEIYLSWPLPHPSVGPTPPWMLFKIVADERCEWKEIPEGKFPGRPEKQNLSLNP